MRRALIVALLAIAAAVGTTAQAQGNTINQLSGTFKDDPNSSISFGVKVNEAGKPVRVTPVHYSNVDLRCKDGSVTEISGTVPGRPIDHLDDGSPFFVAGTANTGGPVTHFQGTVNRDGTKASGDLYAYTATFADGVTCLTGQGVGVPPPGDLAPFSLDLVGHTGTSHGGGNGMLTRHLTGRLYNDPNSSISFDVFVKDGKPVGVSDVTYDNLHMNCSDGSTMPLSGVVQHNKNLISTHKGLAFNAGTPNGTMPMLHFTGILSKSGKRARGTFMGATEGLACTTGDGLGPARDEFRWFAN